MTGYSLHGDTESIRNLFDELQREGIPLDRSLVSRLFDAYVAKYVALTITPPSLTISIFRSRGDIDGGLSLVEEFPSLPPHSSSLMAAMQLSLEAGDEEMVGRVRTKMNEVSGEKNTNNMMFFGHLRAGQVTQANKILEVFTHNFIVNPLNKGLPLVVVGDTGVSYIVLLSCFPHRLRGFPSILATL